MVHIYHFSYSFKFRFHIFVVVAPGSRGSSGSFKTSACLLVPKCLAAYYNFPWCFRELSWVSCSSKLFTFPIHYCSLAWTCHTLLQVGCGLSAVSRNCQSKLDESKSTVHTCQIFRKARIMFPRSRHKLWKSYPQF